MSLGKMLNGLVSGTTDLQAALASKETTAPPVKGLGKQLQELCADETTEATASTLTDLFTEEACDPVLLSGNVAWRMQDMLQRRHNAGLSGQHRVTQRLDKQIMVLRAALGLPDMPPAEVIRTALTTRDPVNGEDLMVASNTETVYKDRAGGKWEYWTYSDGDKVRISEDQANKMIRQGAKLVNAANASFDINWAEKITAGNFAKLQSTLDGRGYCYTSKREESMVHHTWHGRTAGGQNDELVVSTINRWWVTAAVRNNTRLPMFEFAQAADNIEQGIPVQMTASEWKGDFAPKTAQTYASSWAMLLNLMKPQGA